ncbi:Aste57867_5811 [Aphanomyces stellatus]|uniref:Aste57867_5811 protein n=1 Tax=Aphanomyces stellatus TaxID=120398 RepID=A0A485KF21_9STRA|nr:hypothetical protein As57867_005797 [Aphanomyces stellatus]VFT82834.1 Aste57867_5811 [Aphanomyces stellatus]
MKLGVIATCVVCAAATAWAAAPPSCDGDQCSVVAHDEILSFHRVESLTLPRPVARVHRYSSASYSANDPNEDRFVVHVDGDTVYASVLDGHGGWQVSEYVNQHLVNNTKARLRNRAQDISNTEAIGEGLEEAFLDTEDALRQKLLPAFELGFGQVNRVGACTMLAYLKEDTLVVANAGDVRAVLGTTDAKGQLMAKAMSTDHNAKHATEKARLAAEHPNESNIVVCQSPQACYVKGGLQPTRALGDFAFKYPEFNSFPASIASSHRGGGRFIPDPYTPPYILARPEVQSHVLTANDHFLVLGMSSTVSPLITSRSTTGSDGLWDDVTNDEAVAIVHHYASRGQHARAAQALVEQVIANTAAEYQYVCESPGQVIATMRGRVNTARIASLSPGRDRRRVHDDTTVVVLFFS